MDLTIKQACVITDSMNGVLRSEHVPPRNHLYANVMDALRTQELDLRYELDDEELVDFIAKFVEITDEAASDILEKVARFWRDSPILSIPASLLRAGLITQAEHDARAHLPLFMEEQDGSKN